MTMIREFFIGFVKIHILYHASEGPVYGAELIRELARHGYDLSPGTLYPTLHRLQEHGYLERERRVVAGRVRKYYTITPKGQLALSEARQKIVELVREVTEDK
jgi:PadR family transcriptional regulator PadR